MSLAEQSQQWYPTSVQVTALQARGLRIKGKNGTNDAYAVMQVAKDKFSTSVAEKSVAPVWKEEATFDLPLFHPGNAERCALQVSVMHRALVGPDKLLGVAAVNLLELYDNKSRNKSEWFKLMGKMGKPDKDRGEVLLDIQFMKNNMTASMYDLSGQDKSRSRLGKFKDKLKGKKKDGMSDSASAIVPSVGQILTDSEGEEEAGATPGTKKKSKLKSLFAPKGLHRNMSQSMSTLATLPEKDSAISLSRSSGLNVESPEAKKKFRLFKHKRTGSSDSKVSAGSIGQGMTQSNLCINGSHVYTEEPETRDSRAGSTFSLNSSGHGSMEDVRNRKISTTSVDSLRASDLQTQESAMEEMLRRQEEQRKQEEEVRKRVEEERRRQIEEEEREQLRREEMRKEEERMRIEREEERRQMERELEKRRLEEQEEERRRIEREEEMKRLEEQEEERRRIEREEEKRRLEKLEEERKRIEREEEIKRLEEQEEEKRRIEREEEKIRLEKQAEERRRIEQEMEGQRRIEEIERKEELARIKREQEKARQEEERKMEEEERMREEKMRLEKQAEERRRIEQEMEEQRRIAEEEMERKEELARIKREQEKARQEEERKRAEEERMREEDEERIREEKRKRMEEEEKTRLEKERMRKEEEMRRQRAEEEGRLLKEKREAEEMRKRKEEEERRIVEEKEQKEKERLRLEKERMELERKEKEEMERMRNKEEEEERKAELEKQKKERMNYTERPDVKPRSARMNASKRAEKPEMVVSSSPFEDDISLEETSSVLQPEALRSSAKVSAVKPSSSVSGKFFSQASVPNTNPFLDDSEECSDGNVGNLGDDTERVEKKRRAPMPPQNKTEGGKPDVPPRDLHFSPSTPLSGALQTHPYGASAGSGDPDVSSSRRDKRPAPLPPDVSKNRYDVLNKECADQSTTSFLEETNPFVSPGVRTAKHNKGPAPAKPLMKSRENSEPNNLTISCINVTDEPSCLDELDKSVNFDNLFASKETVCAESETVSCKTNASQNTENVSLESVNMPEASKKKSQAPLPPVKLGMRNVEQKSTKQKLAAPQISHKIKTEDRRLTINNGPPTSGFCPPMMNSSSNPSQAPETEEGQRSKNKPLSQAKVSPIDARLVAGQNKESERKKSGDPDFKPCRPHAVKPLSTTDSQPDFKENQDNFASAKIADGVQVKMKAPQPKTAPRGSGPYSQLTHEELVNLLEKQKVQMSQKDSKIMELEQYIDNLLLRVMEEQPSILMTLSSMKKSV